MAHGGNLPDGIGHRTGCDLLGRTAVFGCQAGQLLVVHIDGDAAVCPLWAAGVLEGGEIAGVAGDLHRLVQGKIHARLEPPAREKGSGGVLGEVQHRKDAPGGRGNAEPELDAVFRPGDGEVEGAGLRVKDVPHRDIGAAVRGGFQRAVDLVALLAERLPHPGNQRGIAGIAHGKAAVEPADLPPAGQLVALRDLPEQLFCQITVLELQRGERRPKTGGHGHLVCLCEGSLEGVQVLRGCGAEGKTVFLGCIPALPEIQGAEDALLVGRV